MRSAAEMYRTRKPDVPPKHLVAYFAVVDVTADRNLLVDHINAGLPASLDPHLPRFVTKLQRDLAR